MRCLDLCKIFSVRASPAALRDGCPKCVILIAALRQASKLATFDAEYVSEVRKSHSRAMPSKQIAEFDPGYVSEMHYSHSCGSIIFKMRAPGFEPGAVR